MAETETRPRRWQFFSRWDRDETLVRLEIVLRPRHRDRDHNPGKCPRSILLPSCLPVNLIVAFGPNKWDERCRRYQITDVLTAQVGRLGQMVGSHLRGLFCIQQINRARSRAEFTDFCFLIYIPVMFYLAVYLVVLYFVCFYCVLTCLLYFFLLWCLIWRNKE